MAGVKLDDGLGRFARLSAEELREISRRGGRARQAKRLALVNPQWTAPIPPLASVQWPAEIGEPSSYIDRVWTPEIIRGWQQTWEVARQTRNSEAMVRVLTAMTALCPQLAPGSMKQAAAIDVSIPSSADLSHLSLQELAHLTGRKLSESEGERARPKRARKRSAPRQSWDHDFRLPGLVAMARLAMLATLGARRNRQSVSREVSGSSAGV